MIPLALILTVFMAPAPVHTHTCAVGHWNITFVTRGNQSRSTFKGTVSVSGIKAGESIILGLRCREPLVAFVSPPLTNRSTKTVWMPYNEGIEVTVFQVRAEKMILRAADNGYDHGTRYWEMKGPKGKGVLKIDSDPFRYLAFTPNQSTHAAFLLAGHRFLVENDDADAPWFSPKRKFRGPLKLKKGAEYSAIGYRTIRSATAHVTLRALQTEAG